MHLTHDDIEALLGQLGKEGMSEGAMCALIDLDDALLPILEQRFRSEPDAAIRESLVRAIWQHRIGSSAPFLGEALRDRDPRVWKEALDGLVILNCPEARAVLTGALQDDATFKDHPPDFREWLDEALAQLTK